MQKLIIILFVSTSIYSQTNISVQNKILEDVYYWDQHIRKSYNNCSDQEHEYTDSVNRVIVKYIINTFGFPLTRAYSKNAINGIYYTIQHDKIEVQQKYFQQIKQLSDSGFISKKHYAMTYDRILSRTTGKQKYGEQRYHDTTDHILKYIPFINIDSVQIFRKQLGLDSIDLNKKTRVIIK
jgi:hypothetical protein